MRPIDAHVHVGRWRIPEFAGRTTGLADAVAVYLRWNWAGALLFPTDEGDNQGLLDAVRGYRGSVELRVGYWADPGTPGNLESFRHDGTAYAALKIHPSCLKMPANAPELAPYFEHAAALGIPVVVHCGRWKEVAGFEIAMAAAVHRTCPVILSHMGGDSPHLVMAAVEAAAEPGRDNVFLGTESIREPWLLQHAVERLGSRRIIFGSDHNLNHPEPFRRLIELLDVTDRAREDMMRGNVNGLLPGRHRFF